MQNENVVFFEKKRDEINIYRFYKTGEICPVNYEESLKTPIAELAEGATLPFFKKYKLPVGRFTFKEGKLLINFKGRENELEHEAYLLDSSTLKVLLKSKDGAIKEITLKKLGSETSFLEVND